MNLDVEMFVSDETMFTFRFLLLLPELLKFLFSASTALTVELAPGPATYLLYIVAGPEVIGSRHWTSVSP